MIHFHRDFETEWYYFFSNIENGKDWISFEWSVKTVLWVVKDCWLDEWKTRRARNGILEYLKAKVDEIVSNINKLKYGETIEED